MMMMAITRQDIAVVVTIIIVLNSLLYANFVTTKAYAQHSGQEWQDLQSLPPEQQLETMERWQ
jgi:hypothetical protein